MENNEDSYYILDSSNQPIKVNEFIAFEWRKRNNVRVAFECIDNIQISTIFLTLAHGHDENGKPFLWETFVRNLSGEEFEDNEFTHRYTSYSDALNGHIYFVKSINMALAGQIKQFTKKEIKRIIEIDSI